MKKVRLSQRRNSQKGLIELPVVAVGVLIISALVLPLATRLVQNRQTAQQLAVGDSGKSCRVEREGYQLTATGSGDQGEEVRLWLARADGAPINPAPVEASVYEGVHYYRVGSCRLQDQRCQVTYNIDLPEGDYQYHCDLPEGPGQCSGNPFCDFNGGTTACPGWVACGDADSSAFSLPLASAVNNCYVEKSGNRIRAVGSSTIENNLLQLYVARQDGQPIDPPPTAVSLHDDVSYYRVAYQNLVNGQGEVAYSLDELPPGADYYWYFCDFPNQPGRCSGNPFCDFNGGTSACPGWEHCNSADANIFSIAPVDTNCRVTDLTCQTQPDGLNLLNWQMANTGSGERISVQGGPALNQFLPYLEQQLPVTQTSYQSSVANRFYQVYCWKGDYGQGEYVDCGEAPTPTAGTCRALDQSCATATECCSGLDCVTTGRATVCRPQCQGVCVPQSCQELGQESAAGECSGYNNCCQPVSTPAPTCGLGPKGDLNCDGCVNNADSGLMRQYLGTAVSEFANKPLPWGELKHTPNLAAVGSSVVDIFDAEILRRNYLTGCAAGEPEPTTPASANSCRITNLSASEGGTGEIQLSWVTVGDRSAVRGLRVFRDGYRFDDLSLAEGSYQDREWASPPMACGTSHTYRVCCLSNDNTVTGCAEDGGSTRVCP